MIPAGLDPGATPSTIVEVLHERAARTPDRPACVMAGEALSFGQLHAEALRTARALARAGVRRGDRCALVLPTGLAFIRLLFGTQALGAIPVAVNPAAPTERTAAALRLVRARLAVLPAADSAAAGALAALVPDLRVHAAEELRAEPGAPGWAPPGPDDVAILLLTSGTSGEPRAAVVRHRSVMASVRSSLVRLAVRPDDVFVNWVPLFHSLGLNRFIFGPLYFGCPVHLIPAAVTNLQSWLETISRVRATVTGGPDFGYRVAGEFVDPGAVDLRSLRFAMNSGEPIRLATVERFEARFGVPGVVRPGYGLAEANGVCTVAPGERLRIDPEGNIGCGRPLDGLELAIVDEEGHPLPPGSAGEIRVRGEQVFAGYFEDDAATRERLRDGWLCTGDLGRVDHDGHLYVLGRQRAVIKRGGALIAPRDLEEAAEQVAGVHRAAAIGVPRASGLGTEEIVIVAEVDPDRLTTGSRATVHAIGQAVARVRGFTPTDVVLVAPDAIPRTPNGKVRHEALRQLYMRGDLGR